MFWSLSKRINFVGARIDSENIYETRTLVMSSVISSDKVSILNLFSDFWFRVPYYQRPYLWQRDNVEELLEDLWFASENNPNGEYFLGALVLDREDEHLDNGTQYTVYDVIDGQQRLSTLMLVMTVLRDIYYDADKDDDAVKVMQDFIYQEGKPILHIPERTRITYKIRDKVEDFIKQWILPIGVSKQIDKVLAQLDNADISVRNMANNLQAIRAFFQEHIPTQQFLEFLIHQVVCIYVATDDRNDAFRLFSIVNNRGIPLTNADILKASNIGVIPGEHAQAKYAELWEEIENSMGNEGFERFLSFLRTILVKEKARLNLADEFDKNIYAKGLLVRGEPTIKFLQEYSEIYSKVIDLEGINISNDYKNLLTIMRIGLPSEDWIPPLLAFYYKFKGIALINQHLTNFLRRLEAKFSSDWILGYSTTKRLENVTNILKKIDSSNTPQEVLNDLQLYSIDIGSLRNVLSQDLYGRTFTRYILLRYEYIKMSDTVHLSGYKNLSVEHILPQNPAENSQWLKEFNQAARDKWTHKLGNLTLISRRKNSALSNLDFNDKMKRYLINNIEVFAGTKVFLASQSNWTLTAIERRQKEMIDVLIERYTTF